MTRIRYKRIFWHLYRITEENPLNSLTDSDTLEFEETRTYLKWDPKLTRNHNEKMNNYDKFTIHKP